MMKRKLIFLEIVLGALILLISFQTYVQADVVKGQQKTSSIEVTITDKTLSLENITVPKFSAITLTEEAQTVNSTQDLSIAVTDKRSNKKGSWSIYYSLSSFLNSDNESIANQSIHVGKGKIVGMEEERDYTSYSVDSNTEDLEPLVTVTNTTKEHYEYRVPKSTISMTIPSATDSGTYEATQRVVLVALPSVE